ncbi:imidazole glycerol phosphate synthase subunit HisH [Labilibaculum manganireducens]|uniref:Imidazole glycerol phosphate synthase subunit HisH n=1 Tax=Labilibaculum manganireducens TaxID=1940525 RepID=A0A2N3IEE3_9BACT|nr:imidazole glycerol phosphate synthase subunit HisH [Labilibaculum manganireducens]PKQ68714.1 imidazole glycerol phosphate synthase subunit HisH [Labilibaculum manganireducens]
MKDQKIVIIDYDAGNIQSVKYAFERLGITPVVSNDEEVIRSADKVIFPGVGEAAWAMNSLRKNGLDQLIPQLTQPVLGICLGMQLMCESSEESNTKGLGIFPLQVKRFTNERKVPHMGWNQLEELKGSLFKGVSEMEFAYFVHSYYVPCSEETVASCDYILNFSASLQKDNFYACQFHPEKSGEVGVRILENFINL